MVTVWELLTPVVTLPKLTLDGMTEIWGCMPVPLREIVAGELVALLMTLMLPPTAPVAAGEKLTESGRLCPEARVAPPEKPVTANPAPAAATCEMLTLPVPVFVTVTACDVELPTNVLPKLRLDTLGESKKVCDCVEPDGMPTPETLIEIGPPLLWPGVMTMLPLNVVAASGLNTT
jgi:hypothetical protein